MNDEAILHSVNSWEKCLVNFVNYTPHNISLEWLDFQGNHVRYADSLMSLDSIKIQTYVGHPWVVYEEHFRHEQSLTLERSNVYFPGPPSSAMDLQNGTFVDVPIFTPLKSLEKLCLELIHKKLHSEMDLEKLSIHPLFIKKVNHLFYNQKNINIKITKLV